MTKNGDRRANIPDCSGERFALVVARFYDELANMLVAGAQQALRDCKVSSNRISVHNIPGCFEMPLACRKLIDVENFDALVALGAVIRGETPHFEYIAAQCARGIMDVQLATGVPIGFGVLTTEDFAQAQERADPARGNKGYAAALAAATLLTLDAGLPRAGFRRT